MSEVILKRTEHLLYTDLDTLNRYPNFWSIKGKISKNKINVEEGKLIETPPINYPFKPDPLTKILQEKAQNIHQQTFLTQSKKVVATLSVQETSWVEFSIPEFTELSLRLNLDTHSETGLTLFFDLKEGSKVNVRFLYNNPNIKNWTSFHILNGGGQFDLEFLHLKTNWSRYAWHCYQIAENAETNIRGTLFGDESSFCETNALMFHQAVSSKTNVNLRQILKDKAVATFSGLAKIDKIAPKSEAYQNHQTLLLSDEAQIFTRPRLEIDIDEVQCSHGATIGSLDPEQEYYLRSRGFSQEMAHSILLTAFASAPLQDESLLKALVSPPGR